MTKNINRNHRYHNPYWTGNHESNFNWLRDLVTPYKMITSPKIKEV